MSEHSLEIEHRIREEADEAHATYGDFASMHEAWGVLAEEFEEFKRAVMKRHGDQSRPLDIEREAIQIAAVATRIAKQARRVLR